MARNWRTNDDDDSDALDDSDAEDPRFSEAAQWQDLAGLLEHDPHLAEGRPGSLLAGVICAMAAGILLLLAVARDVELLFLTHSLGVGDVEAVADIYQGALVYAGFAALAVLAIILLGGAALDGSPTGQIGITLGAVVAVGAEVARMIGTVAAYDRWVLCALLLGAAAALWLPASRRYVSLRTARRRLLAAHTFQD